MTVQVEAFSTIGLLESEQLGFSFAEVSSGNRTIAIHSVTTAAEKHLYCKMQL